ncbi:hypothetical protein GCM10017786_64950 [Amycolatopsis deserti]|uniref:Secreted protein n=1 Tax=Amycolatopsis deserti TaxID=185696 RepID=A0ABQ3JGQ0_9PSEU|nr:hypothetical protein [Amycolatopsis deserti]GHF21842.1 hypothetical protein GCM10017786_64950 [Amycolatopsis deserti]
MRVRLVLAAAGLLAVLTACGSDGGGSGVASLSSPASTTKSAPAAGTEEDQARAFAKCMREHGVDMPDPKTDGGGINVTVPEGVDRQKAEEATEACKGLLPNAGAPKAISPEDLDRQRQLAKCLREHGVNVPDPTADDPGIKIQGSGPDDPRYVAAMEACQQYAGKGGETQNNEEGGR